MNSRFLQRLGLAYRARAVALGDTLLQSFMKGEVKYLIIASDASDKTKERFFKKCHYYGLPYNDSYTSQELSKALGKNNIKVVGICQEGMAAAFMKEEGGINNGETKS